MTLTNRMFLSMLVSAIVFFVLWFGLGSCYGNHALWLAFVAYLATRSLMQTSLFIYGRISFRS
jgi:MATE family multidrug resistance protein